MKVSLVARSFLALILAIAGTRSAHAPLAAASPGSPASRATRTDDGPLRADTVASLSQKVPYRVRSDVDLVLVEVTVRDQHGGIVDDLAQQDFHIYEDGVEQKISTFSRDELPLAVALVLDCSGSMDPVLRQLSRVAAETLSPLKPNDEVALFDFAARADLRVGLTTNRRRIVERIASMRAAGGTVIPDALYEAASYLYSAAPERRHAIILVSDNDNTLKGYADESDVIRQALQAQTVIYSIRVEPRPPSHEMGVILPIFRDVSVSKITQETGGEVIDAANIEAIRPAMTSIVTRLKRRYSLGYYSTNHRHDGAFREIAVRISEDSLSSDRKYIVSARRGYFAPGGEEGVGSRE
jgi:Ca-activated chloride channel homolog